MAFTVYFKYSICATIGLILGLTVIFHIQLSLLLEEVYQISIHNHYPVLTYILLFVLTTPVAVFINRYFNYLQAITYDHLLRIGIVATLSYLLPGYLFFTLLNNNKSVSLSESMFLAGFGIFVCFALAALQAVLLEKYFNRKTLA